MLNLITPHSASEAEGEATVEGEATSKQYTQAEVDALVQKAVNGAVDKAKAKANKSSEDRIAELEKELARRDNQDYCRSKMTEAGIDSSLVSLIYAGSNEASDEKLKTLSDWYAGAVEAAVKEKLKEAKPISMKSSDPSKRHLTLAERQAQFNQ